MDKLKADLNSWNIFYHSFQILLCSHLSENIKIKIYKTVILSLSLYECGTSISYTEGRTQVEGGWEVDAEENTWNKEGGSDRNLENIT
jgi:hypothetical protein